MGVELVFSLRDKSEEVGLYNGQGSHGSSHREFVRCCLWLPSGGPGTVTLDATGNLRRVHRSHLINGGREKRP